MHSQTLLTQTKKEKIVSEMKQLAALTF